MSEYENTTASTIKIIHPRLLVNCRNSKMGTRDKSLPQSFDAADAVKEGISKEIFDNNYEAIAIEVSTPSKKEDTQLSISNLVLDLFREAELFHDGSQSAYCRLNSEFNFRTYKISSNEFHLIVRRIFFKAYQKSLNNNALKEAISTLEAQAIFDGSRKEVYIRVARTKDSIVIDQCNNSNTFIIIDKSGSHIVSDPGISFIRKNGMGELPDPSDGGDVGLLKKHLGNGLDDRSFRLIIGWILGAMRGEPPYPILVLTGEQGSGKSTLSKKLRRLIDPSNASLSCINDKTQDLAIAANSSHMVSIDNISNIKQSISDVLCMTSTTGAFRSRTLFTNDDESILELSNPQLINGINCIPQYPDLLERSLIIELVSIDSKERKTESELMSDFDSDLPKMLGFLYRVLSDILKELPNVHLEKKPRMADFCQFITAAEETLGWSKNTFFEAMEENQEEICEIAMDECSFISAINLFMGNADKKQWLGTISELIKDLENKLGTDHVYLKASDWPKNPKKAAAIISRFAPLLKRHYIIKKYRATDRTRTRLIEITKIE